MRLSEREISSICSCAARVFSGLAYSIWLFGSRTDDTKRGGDVDLLIEVTSDSEREEAMRREIAFLVALKGEIGERKIDVVVAAAAAMATDPFLQGIAENRVLLTK